MERLKGKVILNKSLDPVAVISTKTSLITKDSIYILFNDGTSLAMSQALGHNGITGYAPEKKEIFYESTDKVDIILGSDGFWDQIILDEESADCLSDLNDLFTMTSEQLANKSDARWKQPWKYYWNPKDLSKTLDYIEHESYDDICVGIWSNVARNASVEESVEESVEVVDEDDYDYSDMPGLISTYDVLRNDICRLEMEIFSLDEQKKCIENDEMDVDKIEDIEKQYEDTFQQIIYKIRRQLNILSTPEQISRLNDLQTGNFTHNVIGLNELEIELLLENYYNEETEKDEIEEDVSASASACLELGSELGSESGSESGSN